MLSRTGSKLCGGQRINGYEDGGFLNGPPLTQLGDDLVHFGQRASDDQLSYQAGVHAEDLKNVYSPGAAKSEVSDFNKFVARCNALGLKNA